MGGVCGAAFSGVVFSEASGIVGEIDDECLRAVEEIDGEEGEEGQEGEEGVFLQFDHHFFQEGAPLEEPPVVPVDDSAGLLDEGSFLLFAQ